MGKTDVMWQYHSRSDHHSKVACWGILFDLLNESQVLRSHAEKGVIAFGLNHEMRDFKHNRKKDLDLVVGRPTDAVRPGGPGFRDLVARYGIVLAAHERKRLKSLPDVRMAPVGSVQMALESKACMTEHVKALPRLYDELNSSHETIHASAEEAIAVGFVMVNLASGFCSPGRQTGPLERVMTLHDQPAVSSRVVDKVMEMPRRTKMGEQGFDALSIVAVECRNDGSLVTLVDAAPAPPTGDIFHYGSMIRRVEQLYASRFRQV